MLGPSYDARLLLYQSLAEIPAQVLMLETYRNIGQKDPKVYGMMALLNLGSYLASVKIGQSIFKTLHSTEASPETPYFVSLFTEHSYNVSFEKYKNNVHAGSAGGSDPLAEYLSSAPAYSKTYMDMAVLSSAAKISYGLVSSESKNPLYALLYGLTQPLCVMLDDAGVLK